MEVKRNALAEEELSCSSDDELLEEADAYENDVPAPASWRWSNVTQTEQPSSSFQYDSALTQLKRSRPPLREERTDRQQQSPSDRSTTFLHEEIVRFCNAANLSEREKATRHSALHDLQSCVALLWPHASVQLFGSQATGLALPNSDVDVVVLGEHPASSEQQQPGGGFGICARHRVCRALYQLSYHLKRHGVVHSTSVINAKVPICKCTLSRSGLECDLSLGARNGANAVEFISSLVHSLPPLRPLCLVLKAFLAQRNLNEPFYGGVGGWQLVNMLCTHLQAEGVNVGEEVDLGSCLVAFFHRFGGSLDTWKYALSIERGGIVRKRGALLNRAKPWRLAIEDPQEPNKDIGGAIFNIDAVKRTFGNASVKLNSATPNDGEEALDLWAEVQAESTHRSVEPYSNTGRRVMPMLNNIMSTEAALTRRRVGSGKGRGKRKKEKENKKQKFGTMEQAIMKQQKAEKKKEMAKKGKKGASAKSGKKTQTEGKEFANKKKEVGKKSQSKGAIAESERSGNKRKEAGKRKRLTLGVEREQKARRVMETKS